MHLYLKDSVAAAGFTSSSLDIEAEPPLLIALRLGVRRRRKQITDQIKNSGVGSRIGSGRPPDRRLVNIDHLIKLLHSLNGRMLTRDRSRPVQFPCQTLI